MPSRREFLTGLGAASTAASMVGLTGCGREHCTPPSGLQRFNVVFHGMVAYFIEPDHVNVRMPKVTGTNAHVYKVGSSRETLTPLAPTDRDYYYDLTGITKPGQRQLPGPDAHMVFIRKNDTDLQPVMDKVYCTLCLPFPDVIRGFRVIERTTTDILSGEMKDKYAVNPRVLPVVYTFSYFNFDSSKVALKDKKSGDVKWSPYGNTTAFNLLVYAEPDNKPVSGGDHLHCLAEMIKSNYAAPKLQFNDHFISGPPDNSGCVIGIAPEDMLSLYEPQMSKHKNYVDDNKGGGDPINCGNGFVY